MRAKEAWAEAERVDKMRRDIDARYAKEREAKAVEEARPSWKACLSLIAQAARQGDFRVTIPRSLFMDGSAVGLITLISDHGYKVERCSKEDLVLSWGEPGREPII